MQKSAWIVGGAVVGAALAFVIVGLLWLSGAKFYASPWLGVAVGGLAGAANGWIAARYAPRRR